MIVAGTQVSAAEAEAERGKAIQRYIMRCFSEEQAIPATAGASTSGPLGTNHRLRSSNPLLDD